VGRLLVVGASLAGLRAAQGAPRAGWDGELTVVGEEVQMPYSRPPLSKEFLTDPLRPEGERLADELPEATWVLGETATGIDRVARCVALGSGQTVTYDRLVIATGCRARPWAGPGDDLDGLHTLRRAEDALALRAALAAGSRLAIIGAGFIGCEVAASARRLGLDVTLFDTAPQPMPVLGPLLGQRCAAIHRAHGVDLRLGVQVAALVGAAGRVNSVKLADGRSVDADLVLIALGAVPQTDWLSDSGLSLSPGRRLRSDPGRSR
jgi:NADPH-dependent 2,4-dienoyl-CoA reductase/sulfur reductase-like enzyme